MINYASFCLISLSSRTGNSQTATFQSISGDCSPLSLTSTHCFLSKGNSTNHCSLPLMWMSTNLQEDVSGKKLFTSREESESPPTMSSWNIVEQEYCSIKSPNLLAHGLPKGEADF